MRAVGGFNQVPPMREERWIGKIRVALCSQNAHGETVLVRCAQWDHRRYPPKKGKSLAIKIRKVTFTATHTYILGDHDSKDAPVSGACSKPNTR